MSALNSKHPRPVSKFNQFGEFKSLQNKVKVLGKSTRQISKHREIDTTGKSNVEIDIEVEGPCGGLPTEELNGIAISDPVNNLFLIRQNNKWRKIPTEEL
jgi:hypothetical protein